MKMTEWWEVWKFGHVRMIEWIRGVLVLKYLQNYLHVAEGLDIVYLAWEGSRRSLMYGTYVQRDFDSAETIIELFRNDRAAL